MSDIEDARMDSLITPSAPDLQAQPPAARPRRFALPSARTWAACAQWGVTLATCAFLIVPVVMSILAGLTVNYFRGIASGLTLRWLDQVWTQYHASVFLSLEVAAATLVVTLLAGVPAGYALARSRTRASRWIEVSRSVSYQKARERAGYSSAILRIALCGTSTTAALRTVSIV